MKVCSRCGEKNATGSLFCKRCGGPLGTDSAGAADTTAAIPAVEETGESKSWAEPAVADVTVYLNRATELLAQDRVQEAVEACHEALQAYPSSPEAYSLLGMAEEEAGNLKLAIEAYEEAVRLDPGRIAERERIAQLQAQIRAYAPQERPASVPPPTQTLQRAAPIVLTAAAAVLIVVVGLLLVLHARQVRIARQMETTFQEQLAKGQDAVRTGNYDAAIEWFQQALATKPNDETAREWLTWTQRQKQMEARYAQWQWMTQGGKIIGGANVLPPTPIVPSSPPVTGTGRRVSPPPSDISSRRHAVWPTPTVSETTRDSLPPGPSPIVPPAGTEPGGGSATGTTAPTPVTQQPAPTQPVQPAQPSSPPTTPTAPESRGEITITRSERPAATTPSKPVSGLQLRNQADKLRQQGDTTAAIATYKKAIAALQQEIQDNPALAASKRIAIESCRMAIESIQASEGR